MTTCTGSLSSTLYTLISQTIACLCNNIYISKQCIPSRLHSGNISNVIGDKFHREKQERRLTNYNERTRFYSDKIRLSRKKHAVETTQMCVKRYLIDQYYGRSLIVSRYLVLCCCKPWQIMEPTQSECLWRAIMITTNKYSQSAQPSRQHPRK